MATRPSDEAREAATIFRFVKLMPIAKAANKTSERKYMPVGPLSEPASGKNTRVIKTR